MAATQRSPILLQHSSPPPSLDTELSNEHLHSIRNLSPESSPSIPIETERPSLTDTQQVDTAADPEPLTTVTSFSEMENAQHEESDDPSTTQSVPEPQLEQAASSEVASAASTTAQVAVPAASTERTDANEDEAGEERTDTFNDDAPNPADAERPDAAAEVDSEESRPVTPPAEPKDEIPEWLEYEDDLSVPTEEELKEVEGTDADLDALDIPALEKRIYHDLDDPEQRPIKKLRLSWVIKGVRGTKENPNYARVMNSPYAHVDGYYWQIKFYPRGNKTSSLSAYIKCSRNKPKADEETVESEFTYFEGAPDTNFGRDMSPLNVIKIAATAPKPQQKSNLDAETDLKKEQITDGTLEPVPVSTNREDFLLEDEATQRTEVEGNSHAHADRPGNEESNKEDWRVSAQLGMVIYNPTEPRSNQLMDSEHQFNKHNDDWGWTNFVGNWHRIHMRRRGQRQALLRGDQIAIDAYIRIFEDPSQMLWWHESEGERLWDSKSLTGYWPMGTPPLYHSPAVAGMTAWMLLKPFRRIIQNADALKWRENGSEKPTPFLANLLMVLYMMRYLAADSQTNYVNVYPVIEALSSLGEEWTDVKTFWEVFRRTIELELGDNHDSLQLITSIFDVPNRLKEVLIPPLPVQDVHDVQSGISKVLGENSQKGLFPNFLPIMLERQVFDHEVREWKLRHDAVHLNEEIDLSGWSEASTDAKYTLYGFMIHAGDRNSNRFYSILRPAGPGTKWLAFEDGDGNKIFSYTRHRLREFEGLEGQELKDLKGTRQTAYMAMYIRNSCLTEYLADRLEPYQLPKWLKTHLICDVSDKDHPQETDKNDNGGQTEEVEVEIYADTAVQGRQGLLDMYSLKNQEVSENEFFKLKVPRDKPVKALRADLAAMLKIDNVERIRLWEMNYESVGKYTSANMEPLKLDGQVGSRGSDTPKYLCLWMAILKSEEDVQKYGYPDPELKPLRTTNDEEQDDFHIGNQPDNVAEGADQAEGTANTEILIDTHLPLHEEAAPADTQDSIRAAVAASIAETEAQDPTQQTEATTEITTDSAITHTPTAIATAPSEPGLVESTTSNVEEAAPDATQASVQAAVTATLAASDAFQQTEQTQEIDMTDAPPVSSDESRPDPVSATQVSTTPIPTEAINVIQAQINAADEELLVDDQVVIASLIAADLQAADLVVDTLEPSSSDGTNLPTTSTPAVAAKPQRPIPHIYGFIQKFDASAQTFTALSTIFAASTSNVHASIRAHLSLPTDSEILLWRRESSCTTISIATTQTFEEINFSDGVDIILGSVLSTDDITSLQKEGKFTDPASLSRYLWMTERRHPILSKTTTSPVEICDFGGDYYRGPLVRGQRHGPSCIHITSSGHRYEGPLVCSLKQGPNGTMTYASGDSYTGSWHADERHGQGTLVEKRTGNKYEGGWQNGKKWGKGVTHWEVAEEESNMCQICYNEEIDALFYECGHVVACEACSRMCDCCPICRRAIKGVVRMYRA